jgi:sporulation protein YlmC with PRC-barrel domain
MIRSAQLQGAKLLTEDGRELGRVTELHLKDGVLNTLVYGSGGLLQRFLPWRGGRRIGWDKVRSIEPGEIVVAAD